MLTPKFGKLLLFVALLGVLIYVVITRHGGRHVVGPPAALHGRFLHEEAWIVDEIVRDITEMSAYPAKGSDFEVKATSPPSIYLVSGNAVRGRDVTLDLREDLWSSDTFAALARLTLAPAPSGAAPSTTLAEPIHPTLLNLTAASLVTASATVSNALAANIRDPQAHDAAALVVGAFALRESSWRFADSRWAMNRMTAHLAVARARRGDAQPGVDGQLADVVLSLLKNRQTRALASLEQLTTRQPSAAVTAWARALRMHITQDSRILAEPTTASLLEQREYFRARRATQQSMSTSGLAELGQLGVVPNADWYRIIEAFSVGVEDGNDLIPRVLAAELAESGEVFQRLHGRPMEATFAPVLNARATRLIGDARPHVLPWGAWAEFAQRHIAMFVVRSDNHYRHTLGAEKRADGEKQPLERQLRDLHLFPIATIWWTTGVRGGDAELAFINQAVEAAVSAPELVPPAAWSFLVLCAKYEPARHEMPLPNGWYIPSSPRMAYEAAVRIKAANLGVTADTMEAILHDAPYDSALAAEYLRNKFGDTPPLSAVKRAYGPRLEYDVRALAIARGFASDDKDERMRFAKTSCDMSNAECMGLAWELASAGREYEAAATYERAFAEPSLDAVTLANGSWWLVTYYYRHGRTGAALALADRSADTGSWQGVVTAAYLYERLGRAKEAEERYRDVATHYDDWSQLLGFYYRAVNVRKQPEFDVAWKTALRRVFPDGLQKATTSDARPTQGVIVSNDSANSRKVGLQSGDIIVALEGWAVGDAKQYAAINAFYENDTVTLTAWRGHLFTVSGPAPYRRLGFNYRSYPTVGWREP